MVSSIQDDIRQTIWNSSFYRDVEIEPISRIVPAIGSGIDKRELELIGSYIHKGEVKSVIEGIRPTATMHVKSNRLMEDLDMIASNGLYFLPILKCKPVSGFAHRFYDPEPGKPMDVFGVVARNLSRAKLFRKAFYKDDHRTVGRLLGYPDCCIDFFCRTWGANPRIIDPYLQYAINGDYKIVDSNTIEISGLPETNMMLRYFNIRTAPHIYCKPNCKGTIDISEQFKDLIPKSQWHDLITILDQDMEWNNLKGMVEIHANGFIGIANSTAYIDKKVIRWVS